jgi:hypothetical protein
MERENHTGEPFEGKCPHCGSGDVVDLPQTNLIARKGCLSCKWIFLVRVFDPITYVLLKPPIILSCFYRSPEENKKLVECAIVGSINEFLEDVGEPHLKRT